MLHRIFRGEKKPYTISEKGYECNSGWHPIIDECLLEINSLNDEFTILQIKEKFGGLRIYLDHDSEQTTEIINRATHKAFNTCEFCGTTTKPMVTTMGWVNRLCEDCAIKKDRIFKKDVQFGLINNWTYSIVGDVGTMHLYSNTRIFGPSKISFKNDEHLTIKIDGEVFDLPKLYEKDLWDSEIVEKFIDKINEILITKL